MEFHRMPVSGAFELAPKQQPPSRSRCRCRGRPLITDVYGQRLHGMTMGLRTELAVARAVDKSDLDQVSVHPLPIHERILEAFQALGFRFKHADLERGHIYGVPQTLPFYQEIEFFAAPQYAQTVTEVELTFVTSQQGVEVILECDKRGGFPAPGTTSSAATRSRAATPPVPTGCRSSTAGCGRPPAATAAAGPGLRHAARRPRLPGSPRPRRPRTARPGMGGVVAGAALGVAGGMIAGEMLDDAFDGGGDDFGDFGEE
ncbi:sporulation protein [Micromonospora sp. BRA006-A]|nr:sporulation protein [Micromonospora sp. BRA006-A]